MVVIVVAGYVRVFIVFLVVAVVAAYLRAVSLLVVAVYVEVVVMITLFPPPFHSLVVRV